MLMVYWWIINIVMLQPIYKISVGRMICVCVALTITINDFKENNNKSLLRRKPVHNYNIFACKFFNRNFPKFLGIIHIKWIICV